LHYEGSFEVAAPKEKVYAFVTDPMQVTTIFPDAQDVKLVDADSFTLKVKVGVSFIRGIMDVKMTFAERRPPTYAKMRARGSGMSSTVDLENAFTLEDKAGGGTVVKWTADAKVGGLMASVGSRMMDAVSEKYVKEIIGALNAKLA
jgi:uncharacterized protein